MRSLLAALLFLTRIPLRVRSLGAQDLAWAPAWYGVVGLGLGCVLAGVNASMWRWIPVAPRMAVVLLVSFLLTGGLHLDGLADSADGLLGSGERERSLAIMRDSRIGTFGTVAIVAALGLQWSALAELTRAGQTAALMVAPGLARTAMLAAALRAPAARPEGLGAWFLRSVRPVHLLYATVPVAVAAVWLGRGIGAWCGLWALGAVVLSRWWVVRRLGGQTGDTLGATAVVVETIVSWTFLALRTR